MKVLHCYRSQGLAEPALFHECGTGAHTHTHILSKLQSPAGSSTHVLLFDLKTGNQLSRLVNNEAQSRNLTDSTT